MSLRSISPANAKALAGQGATFADVREPNEFAAERIGGARSVPLSTLNGADLTSHAGRPVIFYCRSGARTAANAERLANLARPVGDAFVLAGGINSWKQSGLPVESDAGMASAMPLQGFVRKVVLVAVAIAVATITVRWLVTSS